jgi:hypothetical protein
MSNTSNKSARILSVVGFSVLSTFFGVGVAWLVVGILAALFKQHGDQLIAGSMPILVAGGALGFLVGLVISVRVAKADQETEQKIEKKYVGRRGRMQIYFGAPLFVVAASTPLLDTLSHHFGDRIAIYSYFGFFLTVIAMSLFLYNRVPERFIIPIGIVGWLLIVLFAVGFSVYMMRQPM